MPGISALSFITGLLARLRSWLRSLTGRSHLEAELQEEFRHHIELETSRLEGQGYPRREAARRAHLEFGHVESYREAARTAKGLRLIDEARFSWIDVKLALRMLIKYPGLTLVAMIALAVGIPVGMAPMHLSNAFEAPLPEDIGDRVRAIRYWNPTTSLVENPTYYEYSVWRSELVTFSALGATRTAAYNVFSEDGGAAPVIAAQVTASIFGILGTPPLLGRTLDPADELAGAPPVAVLGYDLWKARFGGDPAILGRTLRISQVLRTVVGIMPRGFLFPVRHQLWVPFLQEVLAEPAHGLGLKILGRLSEGVSAEAAQAEVGAVGSHIAAQFPDTHARWQAEVVPFSYSYLNMPKEGLESTLEFHFFQLLALALLVVASANVAMLVFARTATRFRELAVRSALGASRVRIVSQLFVETLVLAVGAAGIGLITVDWALGRLLVRMLEAEVPVPYWLTLEVTPEATLWGLLLAVLSAAIASVFPALKMTGVKVQQNIQNNRASGCGIRFGWVTSALIITDVAVALAAVGFTLGIADRTRVAMTSEDLVGIPAKEFLAVELRLPQSEPEKDAGLFDRRRFSSRLGTIQQRLVEQLQAEPRVRGVAVASHLPRMDHRAQPIEVEGARGPEILHGRSVRTAEVDVDFFAALNHPILIGRGFKRTDLSAHSRSVVVNTAFIDQRLEGGNPVGRRLRFIVPDGDQQSPWHEIVGVVGQLGMNVIAPQKAAGIYLPAAPGSIHPLQIAIHLGHDPETFSQRLREIVAEVDPAAVLAYPVELSKVYQDDWYLQIAIAGGLLALVGILLALATSGIYAMMSFSVTERTREFGIRRSLGARRGALILTVVQRSLTQIGIGAIIGMPLAAWLFFELREMGMGNSRGVALIVSLALGIGIVILIGVGSCLVPTRRALRIEPNEALRAEG